MSGDSLMTAARSPLFRSKRALAARSILRAADALARASSLEQALSTPTIADAVEYALRRNKQHFVSGSVLEISTCGAVPPYGPLLAGKLTSLLMLSPAVVRAYRAKYQGEAGLIASQMAARPVVKDLALALLTTTSLYPGRSSQYNRLRLPAGVLRDQPRDLTLLNVGSTGGHGSANFSAETERALAAISAARRGFQNVNFAFGEGQSPKLRLVREGLDALGLSDADLVRHGAERLAYAAPIIGNSSRFLLGVDSRPEYAFDIGGDDDSAEAIAEFWRTRWLASRIEYAPALEQVRTSTIDDALVSRSWRRAASFQRQLPFAYD